MKCESLGITSGTLKHQYLHGMSLNKLLNLTAKLLPFLNVTLSIKRMFSNKPQLGLPKHYSFDIYSIRIPPTEAYQGQHFDFSKGVSSKTNKKWRLMELIRLPSVRRIFLRASVYKASPGARSARATGCRIMVGQLDDFQELNIHPTPILALLKKLLWPS